jgi:hypothetical protein
MPLLLCWLRRATPIFIYQRAERIERKTLCPVADAMHCLSISIRRRGKQTVCHYRGKTVDASEVTAPPVRMRADKLPKIAHPT